MSRQGMRCCRDHPASVFDLGRSFRVREELSADVAAVIRAVSFFRAGRFLRFMGRQGVSRCRQDPRSVFDLSRSFRVREEPAADVAAVVRAASALRAVGDLCFMGRQLVPRRRQDPRAVFDLRCTLFIREEPAADVAAVVGAVSALGTCRFHRFVRRQHMRRCRDHPAAVFDLFITGCVRKEFPTDFAAEVFCISFFSAGRCFFRMLRHHMSGGRKDQLILLKFYEPVFILEISAADFTAEVRSGTVFCTGRRLSFVRGQYMRCRRQDPAAFRKFFRSLRVTEALSADIAAPVFDAAAFRAGRFHSFMPSQCMLRGRQYPAAFLDLFIAFRIREILTADIAEPVF